MSNYLIFDVETTGFSPKNDDIIQFGAILVKDGEIVREVNTYVYTDKTISEEITDITGITQSCITPDLPTQTDIANLFVELSHDATIVGYNSKHFDLNFMKERADISHIDIDSTIDVYEWVQIVNLFDTPNLRLESFFDHLGIDGDAHNALADCYATLALMNEYTLQLGEEFGQSSNPMPGFNIGIVYSANNRLKLFPGKYVTVTVFNAGSANSANKYRVIQKSPKGQYVLFTNDISAIKLV